MGEAQRLSYKVQFKKKKKRTATSNGKTVKLKRSLISILKNKHKSQICRAWATIFRILLCSTAYKH